MQLTVKKTLKINTENSTEVMTNAKEGVPVGEQLVKQSPQFWCCDREGPFMGCPPISHRLGQMKQSPLS